MVRRAPPIQLDERTEQIGVSHVSLGRKWGADRMEPGRPPL